MCQKLKSFTHVRSSTHIRATGTAEVVQRLKNQLENSRIGIIEAVEEWGGNIGASTASLDLLQLFHYYIGVCAHLEKLAEKGVPDAATRLPRFEYLNDVVYTLSQTLSLLSAVNELSDRADASETALNLIDELTGDLTPSNC